MKFNNININVGDSYNRRPYNSLITKEAIMATEPDMTKVVRNPELEARIAYIHEESERRGYRRAEYYTLDKDIKRDAKAFFNKMSESGSITNTLLFWNRFAKPQFGAPLSWYSACVSGNQTASSIPNMRPSKIGSNPKVSGINGVITRIDTEIAELESRLQVLIAARKSLSAL